MAIPIKWLHDMQASKLSDFEKLILSLMYSYTEVKKISPRVPISFLVEKTGYSEEHIQYSLYCAFKHGWLMIRSYRWNVAPTNSMMYRLTRPIDNTN